MGGVFNLLFEKYLVGPPLVWPTYCRHVDRLDKEILELDGLGEKEMLSHCVLFTWSGVQRRFYFIGFVLSCKFGADYNVFVLLMRRLEDSYEAQPFSPIV